MKKVLSVFSALLSLCLLAMPAFAADNDPEIFSFKVVYVGEADRPSTPAPSHRDEDSPVFSVEESPESPAVSESPEAPASPIPEEDKQPDWISGYLRTPGGFEYPEIDAEAFADEIFRLANEERVKASLPEVERREDGDGDPCPGAFGAFLPHPTQRRGIYEPHGRVRHPVPVGR